MIKLQATVRFNRLPNSKLETVKAVRQLVEKATVDITAGAKNRAPYRTGALQESISYEVTDTFTGGEGIVYTNQEYGPYQEFGTRFNAAHPFMRPAAEQVQQQLIELGKQMGASIERAARG